MKTKAWTFYRRSTNKQEVSLDDQKKECEKFAADNKFSIVREFIPERTYASGVSIERDSAFQEMVRLAESRNHGVSFLIVYDVSRFGRLNSEAKIYWEQHFKRHGISVVYVKDDFKNDGSLGDTILKVAKHDQAHQYSVRLSQDTLRGSKTHAALGRSCGGRAPYGYDRLLVDAAGNSIKKLNPGEHKADKLQHVKWVKGDSEKIDVVKRIFNLFDRGIGLWTITDTLNCEKIPSPKNGTWGKSMVREILKNRAYIGDRVYNQRNFHERRWNGGQIRNKPKEDLIICENAHEPLIDKELFFRVQSRFKTRKLGQGRIYHSPYLLSGLMRCVRCNHNYQGAARVHKTSRTPYYICGGYHSGGQYVCKSYSIKTDYIEKFVVSEIKEFVSQHNCIERLRQYIKEALNARHDPEISGNRQEAISKKILETETEIANIINAIKSGMISDSLKRELSDLETKKKSLEQAMEESRQECKRNQVYSDGSPEKILAHLQNLDQVISTGNVEERKALIRAFLHHGEVDPEKMKIDFHFFKFPLIEEKKAERPIGAFDFPDPSAKNIAGAGFEPATSRL